MVVLTRLLNRVCGDNYQPTPPSAARLADMGKDSFAPFTMTAIQLPPLVPAHASAVGPEATSLQLRCRFPCGGFAARLEMLH